jgi:hypothetical protein
LPGKDGKRERREKSPIDPDSMELHTELRDLMSKMDTILANQSVAGSEVEEEGKARKEVNPNESAEERVERETDTSSMHSSIQESIRWRRLATGYQDAAIGVTEEKSDYHDMVTLGIVDIGSRQDNLVKLSKEMGKKPWSERLGKFGITIAVIVALTIVAVVVLQPQDMEIISRTLSSTRNQVIVVGLIVLGLGFLMYERISKQRAAKKASMQ